MSVLESGLLARLRHLSRSRSGLAATVQTFAANLLMQSLNIATGILTARCLGAGGRGAQAAMTMWPMLLAWTMTLGLPSALLYNLKRHPAETRSLFSAALAMGTALGLLAALLGMALVPITLTQYPPTVIRQAQWLLLLTPTTLLASLLTAVLQAREEFAIYNRVRALTPLFTLAGLLALLLFRALTPFTAALTISLVGTPVFVWSLARLLRLIPLHFEGLRESCRRLLSYGVRSYGVDLLNTLGLYLDQVIVVGMLAPRPMGLYVVALSLSRMLHSVPNAVVNVLFPKAAGRPKPEVLLLTGRAARLSTALTALAALTVALCGPLLVRLLYGREFEEAVGVLRILLVEATLTGAVWVLGQAFMALDRPGMVTLLQGVGVSLSIPLLLLLVPRFGLIGAGWALLLSTTARLAFVLANYPLTLKSPTPCLFVTRADIAWARQNLRR